MPETMDLPRYRRLTAPYYRLEGRRCKQCGALQFPAREACGACRGREQEPYRFSGRGNIFSYSEVAIAPQGFSGPYLVALVDLEEGVRVTAQLTDVDLDEVEIGMPVEMVTRRLQERGPQGQGYLVYGYKFRPVLIPKAEQIEARRKAS
ncbi:MAG: Zn-ribbon domain-containing OB-fold protein [Thermoanaerobaculia bacterium]